ncbi:hypothetical protein [Galactobacter valiniphilus]|uniref:Uncharacterized protein n=1 Tax=Galactobacter valiniphilus TaxID=2676122 RepID=A0A399JEU4_9MICC|nr:hypothetical protein [Galactobacter valiniphilus]RII43097.1 hypothetical protein DWB68_03430 [Galactobacter valiniphilus]
MGLFTQSVEVTLSAAGQPLRVTWGGHAWRVCARPVRWYRRTAWWEESARAQRGLGAGLVDEEIWRLQLRLGERDAPRTVHVSHQPQTGRWRLINLPEATAGVPQGERRSA